jgi:hypothetical protein
MNSLIPHADWGDSGQPARRLFRRCRGTLRACADVAQLVERNLAKVEVAGSNPVIRSEDGFGRPLLTNVSATWPSGQARVCKTLYPGSIPGVASSGYNAHNGRLAQRQSAASTRQRSAVQSRQRPQDKTRTPYGFLSILGYRINVTSRINPTSTPNVNLTVCSATVMTSLISSSLMAVPIRRGFVVSGFTSATGFTALR